MRTPYKILIFCVACFSFIGCDRVTKDFAKLHLKDREPLSYFNNIVRLEYVENTGAFLSFGDDWPKAISLWAFSILPLLFLSGFFIYTIRRAGQMSFVDMIPLALIFSGGIGNIIDRVVFDRHVIDFMNLGMADFRTGIFNFADLYITGGILVLLLNHLRKNKTKQPDA